MSDNTGKSDGSLVGALEVALREAGLYEGYPKARSSMAGNLMTRGIEPRQVRLLAEWAERSFTKAQRAKNLASVLGDADRTVEVLADVEIYAEKKAYAPGESDRQPLPQPEEWTQMDLARRVQALVDFDRHTLEQACEALGIGDKDGSWLLEKGRELMEENARKPVTLQGGGRD